jgi:anti-sigma B factor antagonist
MTLRRVVNTQLPPFFNVATSSAGKVLTVRIAGELDVATQGLLRAMLTEILVSYRPLHLIIDLAQLDFCDCAGVRVLTDTQRMAARYGATLSVQHPRPQVRWVLQAMDAVAMLGVTPDP